MKILDLFSGAGGFSLGFHLSGHSVHSHVEVDRFACATLHRNFPNAKIYNCDIRRLPESFFEQNFDVIIGGPPCQGFSVAGSSQFGIQDPRNTLVFSFLDCVERLSPSMAIIENVPNVLTKKSLDGQSMLDIVSKIANELGYSVKSKVLNAANFGVPQARKRAFIVLAKDGLTFDWPEITHSENNNSLFPKEPWVTVQDALEDLPEPNSGTIGYSTQPVNSFQKLMRQGGSHALSNHEPMKHTTRLIERFKVIGPGQSLKDVPMEHGQKSYGSGETSSTPFKYNNYRLDPQKPALTIPASFQSLFVHPWNDRNLTAREGARIMSFPDWYVFEGPKTMMSWEHGLSQYNQIGNAVCPILAIHLAQSVQAALKKPVKKTRSSSATLASIKPVLEYSGWSLDDAKQGLGDFGKRKAVLTKKTARSSSFYDEKTDSFVVGNEQIERSLIASILTLRDNPCPLCNPKIPPFADHSEGMNLLLSKADIHSLIGKGRDNGLDFHIRILSGRDKNICNEVAKILVDLGMATKEKRRNPRTGKQVNTILWSKSP